MVDFMHHPMLGGYTSLKSNALMPTESKLTGQFLAAERMLAHIRKLQKVKSRIDSGEPHSWRNSSRAKDARRRQLMVSGGTATSSIYRLRSSSRPNSGRQSRSSLRQMPVSFSARSRSLGSTGDDLDDMFDNMRSISATGYQSRKQPEGGVSERNGSLSPPTGRGAESGRALLTRAAILSLGQKYENAYDLFVTHEYAFTKPPPQAFTPRMLKTNATSRLSELGYHQPPKRRVQKKPTENSSEQKENKMATGHGRGSATRTMEKPTSRAATSGEKTSRDDLRATNTLMMSDTLMSRLGNRDQEAPPSGVPPLDISLDDDHVRWLQEHKLQQRQQQQRSTAAAVQAKRSNELKSSPNHSPDASTRSNAANMLLSKTHTLREAEELKYLDFLRDVTDDVLARGIFTNKVLKEVFESHIEKQTGRLNVIKMRELLDSLRHDLGIPMNSDVDGFGYTSLHNFSSASARSTNRDYDQGQGSSRKNRPPIPPGQQQGQYSVRRGSSPWLLENVPEALTERSSTAEENYLGPRQLSGETPRISNARNKAPDGPGNFPNRKTNLKHTDDFSSAHHPPMSKSPRVQGRTRSSLTGSDILRSGRSTPTGGAGGYGWKTVGESQDSFAVSSLMSDDYDADILLTDRSMSSMRSSARRKRLKETADDVIPSYDTNISDTPRATSANQRSAEAVTTKVSASKSYNHRSANGSESRSTEDGIKNRNKSRSPASEGSQGSPSRAGWSNVRKSSQSPLNQSPGGRSSVSNGRTTKNDDRTGSGQTTAASKSRETASKTGSRPESVTSQLSKQLASNPSRRSSVVSNRSTTSVGTKSNETRKTVEQGLADKVDVSRSRPTSSLSIYSQKSRASSKNGSSQPRTSTSGRENSVKSATPNPPVEKKVAPSTASQQDYDEVDLTMVTQTLPFTTASTPNQSRRGSKASSKQSTSINGPAGESRRNSSVNSGKASSRVDSKNDENKIKTKEEDIETGMRDGKERINSADIADAEASMVYSDTKPFTAEVDAAKAWNNSERHGSENEKGDLWTPVAKPRSRRSSSVVDDNPLMDTLTAYQNSLEYTVNLDDAPMSDGELATGRKSEASEASTTRSHDPRPRPRPRRGGGRLSRDHGSDEVAKMHEELGVERRETKSGVKADKGLARASDEDGSNDVRDHNSRDGRVNGGGRGDEDIANMTGGGVKGQQDLQNKAKRGARRHEEQPNKVESGGRVDEDMPNRTADGAAYHEDLSNMAAHSVVSHKDLPNKQERGVRDYEDLKHREEDEIRIREDLPIKAESPEILSPVRSVVVEEMSSRESTLRGGETIGDGSTVDITKTLPTEVPTTKKTPSSRNNSRNSNQRKSPPVYDEREYEGGESTNYDQRSSAEEVGQRSMTEEERGHRSTSAKEAAYDSSESLELSDLEEDEVDF